ncbi:MAG: hypothetical protein Q6373_010670, partial [Candidatus Sigynarchaeota archaeon]
HRPNPLFPEGSISRKHLEFMANSAQIVAATYPFLPVELIRVIARSKNEYTCIEIGAHPRTPDDVLLELAKNDNMQPVLNVIIDRPGLSEHVIETFIKTGGKILIASILSRFFYLGEHARLRRYWAMLDDARKDEIRNMIIEQALDVLDSPISS